MFVLPWSLTLVLCLGLVAGQENTEDDLCLCVEPKFCVGPHYAPKDSDYCGDNEVCCKRVESKNVGCGIVPDTKKLTRLFTNKLEAPWTSAVLRSSEPTFQLLGVGSLVHPGVILTAAHIVDGVNTSELNIRIGAFDLNSSTDENFAQVRTVETVVRHPYFNPKLLTNDLALLVLNQPVNMGTLITICLPQQGQSFDNLSGWFAGWGKDSTNADNDEAQSELRKLAMSVVPRNQCQEDFRTSKTFSPWLHLHSGVLCTIGDSPIERLCKGDGGGPLYYSSDEGYYVQAGIASWGVDCSSSEVLPTAFTNVAKYRDWIDDVIGRLSDGNQQHKL